VCLISEQGRAGILRICYVTLGYPPAYGLGGPVGNAYHLMQQLKRRSHSVTVWCSNLSGKSSKLSDRTSVSVEQGVEVVRFNTHKVTWGKASFGIYIWPDLTRYCTRELTSFDVIHLDGYRDYPTLIVSRAARAASVPYVLQARGTLLPIANSIAAKKLYDCLFRNAICKSCPAFIASSHKEAEEYRGFLPAGSYVIAIPNGIDFEILTPLPDRGAFRRRIGIRESQRLIAYLGRLHAIKGIDVLIEAFAASSLRSVAVLAIIGPDEDYKQTLKALIARHQLGDCVTFVDALTGRDKVQAYVDSDVVVCASKSESFGMVAVEAAACGTPVILSNGVGCAGSLADFGCATIVPYGDMRALAAELENVCNAVGADKPRTGLAELRDRWSWERIGAQYEAVYRAAAESRSS